MIKAIIFDLGGVILDMRPLLAKKFNVIFKPKSEKELWHFINLGAIPLCRGEMTEIEFWKKVCRKFKKKYPDVFLKDLWTKDFEKLTFFDREMVLLIKQLKRKYKIGLISNIIKSHSRIIKKSGILKNFDVSVLSIDVRMTKDQKEIFLLAANKLKVKPKECVFIDDIPEYVKTAESAGMKGIHFKGASLLKKELKNLKIDNFIK
ncbi:MAG TPA: HAD family phosphatase [Candidatus Nanoarchaeia archaeon]|nr:HAD family phosphatase [Candidatus Nanoarchaeia archaeon]